MSTWKGPKPPHLEPFHLNNTDVLVVVVEDLGRPEKWNKHDTKYCGEHNGCCAFMLMGEGPYV